MNKNLKNLKLKKKENKRVRSLTREIETKNSKSELKIISKLNKSPKGEKNIKNTAGDIINVNNVDKTYVSGSVTFKALKNVNLTIKKGEFVVILGPSGSGKSTLLNILSGLDRATDGEIIIKDINISALKQRDLTTFRRNNVGFVFQSYNLLLELNAKDNAEMGRQLQMDGNRRLEIDKLFEKVGLKGKEKNAITELSGGQQQRVSIIRALSKNPDIIFADEPTGSLDSETSSKVIDLFNEINKKYKTTIIFVTHDKQIAKFADKVIYVKDGEVDVKTNKTNY